MDIRKITDEELAKELEKFEHETDTSCFECGAEFSASVICWEDVAKFLRLCVKDSQPEGLSKAELEDILVKNLFINSHRIMGVNSAVAAIHAAQERKGNK